MKKKLLSIVLLFFILYSSRSKSVFAADCSNVAPSGDLTISTSCTFSGNVNGVDAGTNTTNTAVLAVSKTGTLTVGVTQKFAMGKLSIQTGGSIVIFTGGSLYIGTPLWMIDSDSDGLPSNTTQIISSSPPDNARRRNVMLSLTTPDINDGLYCPDNTNPSGACNQCANGNIVNIADGLDIFSECGGGYNACNGNGACSLHAKRVFISSTTYNGNLGGLSGADTKCQTLADNASLGGTWKAWLSSTTVSAASRLTHSLDPYLLINQTTKIADDWTDLTDGVLGAPINLSQINTTINSNVWTNTNIAGNILNTGGTTTCTSFTSNASNRTSRVGKNANFDTNDWTNFTSSACNSSLRLYCFEQ